MRLNRRQARSVTRKFVGITRDEFSDSFGSELVKHSLSKMYFDDYHESLMPFLFNGEAKFKVNITPESASPFAAELFSRGRNSDESLEACFRNFLTVAAEFLILEQAAIFEICDVLEDDEGATDENEGQGQKLLTLISVLADSIEFQADQVVQKVKKTAYQDAQIITLPRNRVFLIKPPNWIEDGTGFPLIISNLIEETKRGFAPMSLFESARKKPNYFEYSEFRRMQETRILRLTRASGWQGRTQYSTRITEYYFVNRYLRFVHSSLRLRDYLIEKINGELFPLLRKLGITIDTVSLSGLPTPRDILSIQEMLNRGEIGFQEALKQARALETP